MRKNWTYSDKQFIRDNANTMKDADIAIELSRRSNRPITIHAVRKQRNKMGIIKKPGRGVCKTMVQEKGVNILPSDLLNKNEEAQ